MSAVTVERDTIVHPALLRSLQPGRAVPAPTRPGRRSGRSHSPASRPEGAVKAPVLRLAAPRTRSCELDRETPHSATWRLTDRGIATVLVVGAMIAVAALCVIGLTAARVTSERFQPTASVLTQF